MNWYYKLFSTNSNVNGYEVDNLPIAVGCDVEKKNLARLAERILAAKERSPNADASALEREIDELVYALYGLTPEEIKIVEGKTKSPVVAGA